jgi:molybdopterin synthase catalytic subunit
MTLPAGDTVALVRGAIDVAALAGCAERDGAVCLFLGVVRDRNRDRPVVGLEYEAYEEMALALMGEIAEQAKRTFPVTSVHLVHRLGRLAVGDASVAVAVASPHRSEAFAACRFAIDTLKARVPIWKKEFYADGSEWLDAPPARPAP